MKREKFVMKKCAKKNNLFLKFILRYGNVLLFLCLLYFCLVADRLRVSGRVNRVLTGIQSLPDNGGIQSKEIDRILEAVEGDLLRTRPFFVYPLILICLIILNTKVGYWIGSRARRSGRTEGTNPESDISP